MVKPFYHFFFQSCGHQNSSGPPFLMNGHQNYLSTVFPSHVVANAFFIISCFYRMVVEDSSIIS
jgi:hypothetical protein